MIWSLLFFLLKVAVLSIPVGMLWVWIYRRRHALHLPDWFSGILAQGIISGHKLEQGDGETGDYVFIIVAAIVSGYIALTVARIAASLFCPLLLGFLNL